MLVLQIALGIVLAVLILRFLPQIIGLSIALVYFVLFLAVAAGIIYFFYANSELFFALVVIFGTLIFILLLLVVIEKLREKYPAFERFIVNLINIISYTFNIVSYVFDLIIILFLLIAVTTIPALIAFYIWDTDAQTNGILLNSVIFLILAAIAFWGLIYFIKVLLAVGSFSKWKESRNTPTPETHVKCPDCRELILKESCKCKHCGCTLIPQL